MVPWLCLESGRGNEQADSLASTGRRDTGLQPGKAKETEDSEHGQTGCTESLIARRMLLVACLTSQQHASVSQGRICSDSFTCCHTEIEVADPTFHLTQSQYTDTRPTSPSADLITPGTWQGSHWSAKFLQSLV